METVTGSPLGWFLGGIFFVVFLEVAAWMIWRIFDRRKKDSGKLR